MKKLLVVGVIVLFLGLAIAPSINAKIGELSEGISQNNNNLQLESEFQRIKAYIEMKSDGDCDCTSESDSNIELQDEDKYPVICFLLALLLYPLWLITLALPVDFIYLLFGVPIIILAWSLGCSWTNPTEPLIQGMINSNYTNEIYKTLSESK